MKINIPVEKNLDYEIEITGQGSNGEGVGKIDGFTVFVPGGIKGEHINIKIIKLEKSYAIGKILDIKKSSAHRTEPACPIYKKCGGCNLQHMDYEGQLEFKKQRVIDAMTRIGKLENIKVNDVHGMDNPYRYRNKVQLPVGACGCEIKIGFYAPRTHDIIDMEACLIQTEAGDKISKILKDFIINNNIEVYNEHKGTGSLRHIMIRRAFKTGETMLVLVTNTELLPFKEKLIEEVKSQLPEVTSIIQNTNKKNTNVILGETTKTLWGKDTITDYIGEFSFNISPKSFFQVNPIQTEVLYSKALEYADLTGEETVFDAYCGAGTISLFLAQKAKKVYGVEIIPEAIENAKENALNNNITNVEFLVGEAEKIIPDLISQNIKADVVVVDPPRKGCDQTLLHAIATMSPQRIVYVSCDPGTLARDLAILDTLGYKTLVLQPVDMFPQTAHVECVVKLYRK